MQHGRGKPRDSGVIFEIAFAVVFGLCGVESVFIADPVALVVECCRFSRRR